MTSIRLSPEMEAPRSDLWIELRKTTIKALNDIPCRHSSELGCINKRRFDDRIP